MARGLRIYKAFVKQFFKSLLEYRADFFIGTISFVIQQLASLLFIYSVFSIVPHLKGFDLDQLIFIYAVFLIPRGLDHIFTDNLWGVGMYVRSGDFDKYLLRPVGTLFQIISERIDWNGFAELLMGIVMISLVWTKVVPQLNGQDILVIVAYLFVATLIYTFVKLALASLSFKTKNSFAIMASGYSFSDYAKYPITIYPQAIKIIIMFILPFAFTAYFPAIYIMGIDKDLNNLLMASITLGGLFVVAMTLWKLGIKKYESAGS